jgi:AcrR family transcriptional regulator
MSTDPSVKPPPSPESLTAAQSARRARIVEVGLEMLSNGDYDTIQMREVAEAAEVALGTLYRYFTSKEHLFAAVQLEWVTMFHRQIGRRPLRGQTNLERLSQALHRSIRAFEKQPQFYKSLMILEVTKDPYARELYEIMSNEAAAAYVEAIEGLEPEVSAALLNTVLALLGSEMRAWVLGRHAISRVKQNIDDALRVLFTFRDPTDPD